MIRKNITTPTAFHSLQRSMTRSFRPVLVLFVAALLLVGCRTYGDEGYDSGPKTYEAFQQTIKQLDQDLGRAQSDLRRLESAAESADTLQSLVVRYRTLVEGHEATLQQYRDHADQLSPNSAYRSLHRTYGAIVTDRRLLERQYERTTRKVWATVRDSTIPRKSTRKESDYIITPINYPAENTAPKISMAEALRGIQETPGVQQEE